jgi:hypothetical protein
MQVPSQWRAMPSLLAYLPSALTARELRLDRREEPLLVLRSVDGHVLPLPAAAGPLIEQMREVNAWLSSLPVTLRSGGDCAWLEVPRDGLLPRVATPQHTTFFFRT